MECNRHEPRWALCQDHIECTECAWRSQRCPDRTPDTSHQSSTGALYNWRKHQPQAPAPLGMGYTMSPLLAPHSGAHTAHTSHQSESTFPGHTSYTDFDPAMALARPHNAGTACCPRSHTDPAASSFCIEVHLYLLFLRHNSCIDSAVCISDPLDTPCQVDS